MEKRKTIQIFKRKFSREFLLELEAEPDKEPELRDEIDTRDSEEKQAGFQEKPKTKI